MSVYQVDKSLLLFLSTLHILGEGTSVEELSSLDGAVDMLICYLFIFF